MIIISSLQNKIILVVISIMIFYISLVLYGDINKISEEILKIKLEIIPIVLVSTFFSLFIRSIRQLKFLIELGIKISFKENFVLFLSGMSMIVTPLGIGGLIKSHFLKSRYTQPISKTVPIVMLERYHDLLAVVTIIIISILFVYSFEIALFVSILAVVLMISYVMIRQKVILQKIQIRLSKVKILSKIVPGVEFENTLKELTKPKIFFIGWYISVISFIFDGLSVYLVFFAFDVNLGFLEVSQMYFTSITFGAISFLPAGIGITEGSFVNMLLTKGITLPLSTTIVIFSRIATIWFATGIGFIMIRYLLKNVNK